MRTSFLLSIIILLNIQFSSIAQQIENVKKNKSIRNLTNHQIKMHHKTSLNTNSSETNISGEGANVIAGFQKLPGQDPNISYYETTPIALSNGNIMILWSSIDTYDYYDKDSLFCIVSSDGGSTWNNKKLITLSPFNTIYYLTAMQTNSGRIIVFWIDASNSTLKMVYSDNNGDSWSSIKSIASAYSTWYPAVSQSEDSTIYLSYSRDVINDFSYADIVVRKSKDDGLTWSKEKILANNQVSENMGSIVQINNFELLAVYSRELGSSWGIVNRRSYDGGDTWSAESVLYDSPTNDDNCRVLRINQDTLYLVYLTWSGYNYEDFYYLISEDNGHTWSNPVQFTKYAGFDGWISNLTLYHKRPFISFTSARWQTVYNTPEIWYGTIGITEDKNPPPAVLYNSLYQYYFEPNKLETILGNIADESGIKSAQVNFSLNGGAEYSIII